MKQIVPRKMSIALSSACFDNLDFSSCLDPNSPVADMEEALIRITIQAFRAFSRMPVSSNESCEWLRQAVEERLVLDFTTIIGFTVKVSEIQVPNQPFGFSFTITFNDKEQHHVH